MSLLWQTRTDPLGWEPRSGGVLTIDGEIVAPVEGQLAFFYQLGGYVEGTASLVWQVQQLVTGEQSFVYNLQSEVIDGTQAFLWNVASDAVVVEGSQSFRYVLGGQAGGYWSAVYDVGDPFDSAGVRVYTPRRRRAPRRSIDEQLEETTRATYRQIQADAAAAAAAARRAEIELTVPRPERDVVMQARSKALANSLRAARLAELMRR